MATEIKLPRLGQGMESGTVVRWLKQEGERVEKGEPLYELDTEKVTQEVEADASGVLLKIAVQEGEVPVGQTIAVIGEEGEAVPEGRARSRARARGRGGARGGRLPRAGARRGAGARTGSRRPGRTTAGGGGAATVGRRRPREGLAARAPHRPRAGDQARAGARYRARGPDRRRGRRAGGRRAGPGRGAGGPCDRGSSHARRRAGGRAADLDPEDDRAPADQGLGGAGLPARDVRRHDADAGAARAARRANARRRDEADRLRRAHEGLRRRAPAPSAGECALRRRDGHALPDRRTSGWRSPPTAASSSRSSAAPSA